MQTVCLWVQIRAVARHPLKCGLFAIASPSSRFGIESILSMQGRQGVMQEESAHGH